MALLFWDANGGTTGTGGNGTWDATNINQWRLNSTTGALQVWPNGTPSVDEAAFPTTAGTVTIAAGLQIRANKITTQVTGYTLAAGAGGSLQLTTASSPGVTIPVISVTTALTISAPIGSDAGFTLAGTTPTLTLSGDLSNLTGTVTIPTGGTVAITRAGTYALSSSLALAGTGVLRFTPSAAGSVITLAGTGGDTLDYRFTNTVAGTYTYNYDGFSSPGGAALLTVTHGTAAITTVLNYTDAGDRIIASSFTFDVGTAAVAQTLRLSVTGTGNVSYAALNKTNTATVASVLELNATSTGVGTLAGITQSAGTLSVNKTGTGTWKLTGPGTHTLATTLAAGTLEIGHQLAVQNSTVTVSTGAMAFSSGIPNFTFGGLSVPLGTTFAVPSGVEITYGGNNSAQSVVGGLTGSGTLTKAGTATQTFGGGGGATATAFTGTVGHSNGVINLFDNFLGNASAYALSTLGPAKYIYHSINTTAFSPTSPAAMSGVGLYLVRFDSSVGSYTLSYAAGTFAGLTGTGALTSTGPTSGFTLWTRATPVQSRSITATVRDFGYRTNLWFLYDLTNTNMDVTLKYASVASTHDYSNSVINLFTTGAAVVGTGVRTSTLEANQAIGSLILGGLDVAVVTATHAVSLVLGGTNTDPNTINANFRNTPAAGLVLPTVATINKLGTGTWVISDDDTGTGVGKGLWSALNHTTTSAALRIKTNASGDSWSLYNALITTSYPISLVSGRGLGSTDPLNFYFEGLISSVSAPATYGTASIEGVAVDTSPTTVTLNIGFSAGLSATNNVVPAGYLNSFFRGDGNLFINYGSANTSTSGELVVTGMTSAGFGSNDAINGIYLRDGALSFTPTGTLGVDSVDPLPNCTAITVNPTTKRLSSFVSYLYRRASGNTSVKTLPFSLFGPGNFKISAVGAQFSLGALSNFGGSQALATTSGLTVSGVVFVKEFPAVGVVSSGTINNSSIVYNGEGGVYNTAVALGVANTSPFSIVADQTTSAPLELTGNIQSTVAGGTTLGLRANNNYNNRLSGVISDGASVLTFRPTFSTISTTFLPKGPLGRWQLGGANTFTGGVQLDKGNGVLVAEQDSSFGATTGIFYMQGAVPTGSDTSEVLPCSIELWRGLNKAGTAFNVSTDGQNVYGPRVEGNRRAILIRRGDGDGTGTINCAGMYIGTTGSSPGFAIGFDISADCSVTLNNTAAVQQNDPLFPAGIDVEGGGTLLFNFNANTYKGPTRVLDGRLSIGVFGGASTNSSLGNSTGVASNLQIGTSTTAGVLNIRTASPAAVRAITVGTAGCVIEADNTGGIVDWTPASAFAFSTPNVACEFVLSGTSPIGNVFNYALPDNGTGPVDFVKLGTGFWILEQNLACTGVTWVREGTLHFNVATRTLTTNLAIGHLRNVGGAFNFAGAISVQYGTITPLSSVLVCSFTDDIDVAIVLAGTGKTVIFDSARNHGQTSGSYGVISVTPNSPNKTLATANTISGTGEVKANTTVDLYTEQSVSTAGQGKALGNLDMVVSGTIRTKVGTAQQGRMRYGGDLTFQAGSSLVIGG